MKKIIILTALAISAIFSSCGKDAESTIMPNPEIVYIDKSEPLPIKVVPVWSCPHKSKCSTHIKMYVEGVRSEVEFTTPNDTIIVGTAKYGQYISVEPVQKGDNECYLTKLVVSCGHNNTNVFKFSPTDKGENKSRGMYVLYNSK